MTMTCSQPRRTRAPPRRIADVGSRGCGAADPPSIAGRRRKRRAPGARVILFIDGLRRQRRRRGDRSGELEQGYDLRRVVRSNRLGATSRPQQSRSSCRSWAGVPSSPPSLRIASFAGDKDTSCRSTSRRSSVKQVRESCGVATIGGAAAPASVIQAGSRRGRHRAARRQSAQRRRKRDDAQP